jgi:flagellar protein FlaJ
MAAVFERMGGLFKTDELRKTLRAAHMPVPANRYLWYTILATLLSAAAYAAIIVYLSINNLEVIVLGFIPDLAVKLILFALMVPGVFVAMASYPGLVATGRKTNIDLELPYAVSYMEALSTTMTLYETIRRVFEEMDLFGEVSREFGLIVRDVELFGEDLYTAIGHLQETTPSKNMRDLLDDLLLLARSGGDITGFLAARSTYFRDQAAREMEMVLKTIEIMAEVYVVAFVVGPIAIIIMVQAQNLSGINSLSEWMPVVYLGIIAGTIILIWLLHILLPRENLEISRREFTEPEFGESLPILDPNAAIDKKFLRRMESMKKKLRWRQVLRHPLRYYISDYTYSIIFGSLLALAVTLLFVLGIIPELFPEYTLEIFLCLIVIVFMAPVSLAYEGRRHFINSVEAQIPEFLRELADMKDIGMTLQGAIRLISGSKLGVLSRELRLVSEEIRRGSRITDALVRMEERLGMVSVKRAISLVVKASEVTDYLKDILLIGIADFEHYLRLKRERFNVSFVYVMIVYLSFGIYLYTAYQLNVSFIASFQNFPSFDLSFDTASNLLDMFRIGIILGGFSGIMAGQLSSANPLAGFKHTIIFLIATIIMFTLVIEGQMLGVAG